MADQPSFQHRIPKTVINVLTLAPGTRVRLVGDAIAEVVANPQDGVWLLVALCGGARESGAGRDRGDGFCRGCPRRDGNFRMKARWSVWRWSTRRSRPGIPPLSRWAAW